MPEIVTLRPEHIDQLLDKPIVPANLAAWEAPFAASLRVTLDYLTTERNYCRALLNDAGECIRMWGVSELPAGANLWVLVSMEAMEKHNVLPGGWSTEVSSMQTRFGALTAFISPDDFASADWLEEMGFLAGNPFIVEGERAVAFTSFFKGAAPCAVQ